ncbi:hypothetical protein ACCE15_19190 [Pseudomonas parafulva]|uniref:hypothetical protein n=1 Tax=Pseudomonas parafulva TaxID=157782 RepID=UPI003568FDBA
MKIIKKVLNNLFKINKPKKKLKVKVMPLDPETTKYDSVVDNNYNVYQSEKDSEGKHERIIKESKIELNRLNQNAFEIHFYSVAFDSEFLQLTLEIAALKDKVKAACFPDEKQQLKENHETALTLLESSRKNFIINAPTLFFSESKTMYNSMRLKELTADSVSDVIQYFRLEWTNRKSLYYQLVINHLKITETKLRDELDKMKILIKKDPLRSTDGSTGEGERQPRLKF